MLREHAMSKGERILIARFVSGNEQRRMFPILQAVKRGRIDSGVNSLCYATAGLLDGGCGRRLPALCVVKFVEELHEVLQKQCSARDAARRSVRGGRRTDQPTDNHCGSLADCSAPDGAFCG